MGKYFAKIVELESVTLPDEIWKDVENTCKDYKVSNLGRIYNNKTRKLISLKPHKTYGYVLCQIGNKKDRDLIRVHRIVAEAFIKNPFNKKEVNHINKNRSDNRVENLEWASSWENTQHKYGNCGAWNSNQNKIAPSGHSVIRRKLLGFSNIIIPMLNNIVPLNN